MYLHKSNDEHTIVIVGPVFVVYTRKTNGEHTDLCQRKTLIFGMSIHKAGDTHVIVGPLCYYECA